MGINADPFVCGLGSSLRYSAMKGELSGQLAFQSRELGFRALLDHRAGAPYGCEGTYQSPRPPGPTR